MSLAPLTTRRIEGEGIGKRTLNEADESPRAAADLSERAGGTFGSVGGAGEGGPGGGADARQALGGLGLDALGRLLGGVGGLLGLCGGGVGGLEAAGGEAEVLPQERAGDDGGRHGGGGRRHFWCGPVWMLGCREAVNWREEGGGPPGGRGRKECFSSWGVDWREASRIEAVVMEVESAAFGITGHPAADLESGPGEVRAAKIPMELGTERAAGPGESEAPNSELQWVTWLRKQHAGYVPLGPGETLVDITSRYGPHDIACHPSIYNKIGS